MIVMKKKVIYISGTRADFNLMSRTLVELNKFVDLTVIAVGMHLSEKWGKTIKEIMKYDFKVEIAEVILEEGGLSEMVEFLGKAILKLLPIIKKIDPDVILVEGDRGEMLVGAIIGAHLNISVVHHGGGDISDSIDNSIRNAITMFANYHLTGNIDSYNRLLNIGIPESRLFNVGEPGLDDILAKNYTSKEAIIKKYKINSQEPLLLLIFHPNTKEFTSVKTQIVQILEAIKELEFPTISIYSNADAGGKIINDTLDEYQTQLNNLQVFKHFYKEEFSGLMNVCSAMVGNSSSGLTELPLFKKPFICVGTRQKGRLKTENVIEVDYKKEEIIQAVKKGLYDDHFRKKLENLTNPYGDGKSFYKITNIIRRIISNKDK